jgi:hypothetical protein
MHWQFLLGLKKILKSYGDSRSRIFLKLATLARSISRSSKVLHIIKKRRIDYGITSLKDSIWNLEVPLRLHKDSIWNFEVGTDYGSLQQYYNLRFRRQYFLSMQVQYFEKVPILI